MGSQPSKKKKKPKGGKPKPKDPTSKSTTQKLEPAAQGCTPAAGPAPNTVQLPATQDPRNLFEKFPARNEREALDVDSLINRLLNVTNQRLTIFVPEEELMTLCLATKEVFKSQPMCLELDPPMILIGDTHGQYPDVLRIFAHHGFPPKANYLFLGDYVDRGLQSIETVALLFCYKLKYPNSFFLLRGNHESNPIINMYYGFYKECKRRYMTDRLFMYAQETFRYMPFTAITGGKILSMHGGISPLLNEVNQLRTLPRPNMLNYSNKDVTETENLSLDLIWSDPNAVIKGWQHNPRGASWQFGEEVFNEVIQKLNVELVIRAHQVVPEGYQIGFKGKLMTLFSAPHYMGQFDNAAGSVVIDENLKCSITVFKKQ